MDYNNNMDSKPRDVSVESEEMTEKHNRRELVTKLGKFAAYAAPFTVMALNSKAATASGPHKHK